MSTEGPNGSGEGQTYGDLLRKHLSRQGALDPLDDDQEPGVDSPYAPMSDGAADDLQLRKRFGVFMPPKWWERVDAMGDVIERARRGLASPTFWLTASALAFSAAGVNHLFQNDPYGVISEGPETAHKRWETGDPEAVAGQVLVEISPEIQEELVGEGLDQHYQDYLTGSLDLTELNYECPSVNGFRRHFVGTGARHYRALAGGVLLGNRSVYRGKARVDIMGSFVDPLNKEKDLDYATCVFGDPSDPSTPACVPSAEVYPNTTFVPRPRNLALLCGPNEVWWPYGDPDYEVQPGEKVPFMPEIEE
jgi:hypothetical protein